MKKIIAFLITLVGGAASAELTDLSLNVGGGSWKQSVALVAMEQGLVLQQNFELRPMQDIEMGYVLQLAPNIEFVEERVLSVQPYFQIVLQEALSLRAEQSFSFHHKAGEETTVESRILLTLNLNWG